MVGEARPLTIPAETYWEAIAWKRGVFQFRVRYPPSTCQEISIMPPSKGRPSKNPADGSLFLPTGVGPFDEQGIGPLDVLLGGRGIPRGAKVLLRGQPGAGKTTLALQIARSAFQIGFEVMFVAVEEDPEFALNQITQSLWEQDLQTFRGRRRWWFNFDLTEIWRSDDSLLETWLRSQQFPIGNPTPGGNSAIAEGLKRAVKKWRSSKAPSSRSWSLSTALTPSSRAVDIATSKVH
jgi:hypothetical protein